MLIWTWDTRLTGRVLFFFQAEDGIRDLVRSRGLGDVYKRQVLIPARDEEQNIPATLGAVLANKDVEFEVIVLDLSLIHI